MSEAFSVDDNRLKAASFDTTHGFGLRAVNGEAIGFAHATDLSMDALERAAASLSPVLSGHSGTWASGPMGTGKALYMDANPLDGAEFADKVKLLEEINAYARAKDSRAASFGIAGRWWQAVSIIRPDSAPLFDVRPLVQLDVSVVVGEGERQGPAIQGAADGPIMRNGWRRRTGSSKSIMRSNKRSPISTAFPHRPVKWMWCWGRAIRILLHEAVGHGLEGDFNRKKTSAFSDRIGERVTGGVTVIDDGTIPDRRGSLTIDDEGTPTSKAVLIEDGILKGYMQNRQNARLMGMDPTGWAARKL